MRPLVGTSRSAIGVSSNDAPSVAHAVVAKDDGLFLICNRSGLIPLTDNQSFGLYFHDCRFISGYELAIAGTEPTPLGSTAADGYRATIELANTEIHLEDGPTVRANDVALTWTRVLDGARAMLHDEISFTNFGTVEIVLPVSIAIRATFDDIFSVRGRKRREMGTHHPPTWRDGVLECAYDGIDGVRRMARVAFDTRPASTNGGAAAFLLRLVPREPTTLRVSISLGEGSAPVSASRDNTESLVDCLAGNLRRWLDDHARVESDNPLLNRLVERSVRDLHMLRTRMDHTEFIAAGVPWFVALFGRDSIVTALESLAFDHRLGEQTLRLLARYQGTRTDAWRAEQPGKIHHELRVGELTRAGQLPYSPYYGTVDATPLFLILLGRHAAWTGDLRLFDELRANVERALEWMAVGGVDDTGYLTYGSSADDGLTNQGWKDSGDAIVNADGTLAAPPIALAEVQGYAFLAKRLMADLFRRSGDERRADSLEAEARDLRTRFNTDFWLDDEGCYALALQRGGAKAEVVSSNAGQVLWSGIAEHDKARRTAERLFQDDMFSGWGIRTLSARAVRYNPVGYHVGTVWPHDNALIAAGCRLYGLDSAIGRIFDGITAAGGSFEHYRLPELFAGFARGDLETPVRYPVANHPQAWGAGSVLSLMQTTLGLLPEAFDHRLRVVRPMLPSYVDRLEVHRILVGNELVDLRFIRAAGCIEVEVLSAQGGVDVVVER